jgi:hypothetical protein
LWRGPAYEDVRYEAFAIPEVARLEEPRLAAHEERIEADLALGRHRDLVPELELEVRAQASEALTAALGARRLAQAEETGRALSLDGAVERALCAAADRLSEVLSD